MLFRIVSRFLKKINGYFAFRGKLPMNGSQGIAGICGIAFFAFLATEFFSE